MPSTQQQQTTPDDAQPPALDTRDNAAKMSAVDDLLGIPAEEPAKPEKVEPTDKAADQTVAELLAEAEKPPDSGENQETVKPPKTLLELSERTGIKVEDLFKIEFALPGEGEILTLGKLKDDFDSKSDFAGRELELEERRVKFGNDQAKARQELELVLQALPPDAIKADILAKARKERAVMLDREAARVIDVIPEWNNDETKRADLAGIGEHMEQYGFDKGHIDQIADHRMLRYMRDNLNRKTLVERALAGVKPVKPVPKGRTTQPAKSKPTPTATPESSQNAQLDAIDSLIAKG